MYGRELHHSFSSTTASPISKIFKKNMRSTTVQALQMFLHPSPIPAPSQNRPIPSNVIRSHPTMHYGSYHYATTSPIAFPTRFTTLFQTWNMQRHGYARWVWPAT